MKLFESFRSAADKYGDTLAREMLTAGIPDKYILAACRFHQESNGKESDILAVQFRQWMSFVVPKDKTIDVNKLSYTEFTQIIVVSFNLRVMGFKLISSIGKTSDPVNSLSACKRASARLPVTGLNLLKRV